MSDMNTVIYPVKDASTATDLFRALLGTDPYVDAPYYIGFRADGLEVGLDPNGHAQGLTGPVNYWNVSDIEKTIEQLRAVGAEVQRPATDVGGGKLVAVLTDADGNAVGLMQASA